MALAFLDLVFFEVVFLGAFSFFLDLAFEAPFPGVPKCAMITDTVDENSGVALFV